MPPAGMAPNPQIPNGPLPPGLGPQQGQPIPLGQMLPPQLLAQLQQPPGAPHPLIWDADKSVGITPTDNSIPDPSQEDDGLPGHRLLEMYNSWEISKVGELSRQLRAEQYYHGYQWTDKQLKVLEDRKQPPTYFNELRKKIDSYVGIEQRLRRDPKAQPRSPMHEGDCDAVTAALREINETTNAPLKYSESGRDFFVRGIGVLWQGIERDQQGNVAVIKRRVPGMNFLYDPRSQEWDFSDAKFMGEWGLVDLEDARQLFVDLGMPDSADKIEMLAGNMASGSSTGLPGEWSRIKGDWFNRSLQRVRLVHMYYRYRRQWRCAYLCGYIKLYDKPSIYKDEDGNTRQPFHAVSCNIDDTGERYGVVKDLIPIQDSINVRSSKLTWLISARQMIYEEGAVADPNLAREQFKRPDGMIKLLPGGLAKVKIEALQAEIAGQAQLLQDSIHMMQNFGPNPSLIGKDNLEASGRAILARQNSGMTEMSPVFERHREFKLKSYKRDWLLVRQFWTQEKWIRATDDDKGFKFLPINQIVFDPQQMRLSKKNDIAKMDIDIIIDEGPDVITQNEELIDILGKLGPQAMTPLGKVMIELSNVRNKDKLLKILEEAAPKPNPEQADLQAKKNFLEVAQQAADIDKTLATVESTRAKTLLDMAAGMIPSQAMQAFPFEYGAPTSYEDFLGQPLHPGGNPNQFVPQPPPMPMPPMGAPSPQGAMPPMPNHPVQGLGLPPAPALPGQIPHVGAPGVLPLPPERLGQSPMLTPPPNTRP